MITKVQVGLQYNPDFLDQNREKMSKKTGEAFGVLNDYLNRGGYILAKERIETDIGTEILFIVYAPDIEEPTP